MPCHAHTHTDRHDWTVNRCGKQVRYVIDYYSGREDEPGVPVFHADIRPALDSPGALVDRVRMGMTELWDRWRHPARDATIESSGAGAAGSSNQGAAA
jgi:cytochrome c heme-lyase